METLNNHKITELSSEFKHVYKKVYEGLLDTVGGNIENFKEKSIEELHFYNFLLKLLKVKKIWELGKEFEFKEDDPINSVTIFNDEIAKLDCVSARIKSIDCLKKELGWE